MSFIRWLVGGLLGGGLGIALWAAVVHFTGYEVGIIAWLLGVAVGVGVAAAAGPNRGFGAAVFAGLFALLTIIGGKGAVAWIYSQQLLEGDEEYSSGPVTEEYLISGLADEVVDEYEWEGRALDYPPDADRTLPESEADYPPDVWEEATNRWYTMSQNERDAYRAGVQFGADAMPIFAFVLTFLLSFGLFDIVWIFLAVGSACRIAGAAPGRAAPQSVEAVTTQDTLGFVPIAAPSAEERFTTPARAEVRAETPAAPLATPAPAAAPSPSETPVAPAATEPDASTTDAANPPDQTDDGDSGVFFPGAMPDLFAPETNDDLRQAG